MASHTATPLPNLTTQFYSQREWDQKQAIITKLYRDEAKKLDDVCIILAERHGFRPSKFTLKKHIHKWGLDRKHKLPDMIYALRVASERRSQGKETTFLIRARVVTFEDIKHYFKRRGDGDLRSALVDAATAKPTTAVQCQSPEPASLMLDVGITKPDTFTSSQDSDVVENVSDDADLDVVMIPNPNQVDLLIPVKDKMGQLDRLLHIASSHYVYALVNAKVNLWATLELRRRFYSLLNRGIGLLDCRKYAKAFSRFRGAFNHVQFRLRDLSSIFLPSLCSFVASSHTAKLYDIISILLDFVVQMLHLLNPRLRPMAECFVFLHSMTPAERRDYSVRIADQFVDVYDRYLLALWASLNHHDHDHDHDRDDSSRFDIYLTLRALLEHEQHGRFCWRRLMSESSCRGI